jgi:hypothetical protein
MDQSVRWLATELPGFDSRQGQDSFSAPQRQDRRWGPASFLYNGYLGLFPVGKAAGGLKLITELYLVRRLRKRGAIPALPHTSSVGLYL